MTDKTIDLEAVLGESQLPALPQSALRLLGWSDAAEVPPDEFAAPIEADPGMAAQVLRFVNSSYFGFVREVASVKMAVALVGPRTIKNFALWSAVFSLMPSPRCGAFDLQSLWKDSLKRGLLARAIVRLLKSKDAEEAFAAALLQDMALPLLVKALGDDYTDLLAARQASGQRLSALERERFGWTHADAARVMAHVWNLPPGLAELVAHHTQSELLFAADRPAAAQSAVTLSALAPPSRDDAWHERETFEAGYAAVLEGQRLEPQELFARVDHEFEELAPTLKMSGLVQPLSRFYQEAPAKS